MNKEEKISKFPKNFFTSLKINKTNNKTKNNNDKTFIWSNNTIKGKSKVKLVSLNDNN